VSAPGSSLCLGLPDEGGEVSPTKVMMSMTGGGIFL
jgi:hypothetical protein